jgi:hypothetical protein
MQGVLLLRIEESLYFANIGKIKDMFARIERFGSTDAGASEPTLPPLQVTNCYGPPCSCQVDMCSHGSVCMNRQLS